MLNLNFHLWAVMNEGEVFIREVIPNGVAITSGSHTHSSAVVVGGTGQSPVSFLSALGAGSPPPLPPAEDRPPPATEAKPPFLTTADKQWIQEELEQLSAEELELHRLQVGSLARSLVLGSLLASVLRSKFPRFPHIGLQH